MAKTYNSRPSSYKDKGNKKPEYNNSDKPNVISLFILEAVNELTKKRQQ